MTGQTWTIVIAIYIFIGLGLVGTSGTLRFTSGSMTDTVNDRWRFLFFIGWTLSLPLALLVEYHCPNWFWPQPPHPLTLDFTYGRKVISDVWTAVAAVLALLAWNTRP